MNRFVLFLALSLLVFFPALARAAEPVTNAAPAYSGPFPRPLDSYQDQGSVDAGTVLISRAFAEPFNVIATVIFLLAIIHTFLAPKILHLSHRMQHAHEAVLQEIHGPALHAKMPRRLRQS